MELSQFPLMLLLISIIHPGHGQERPKAVVIIEPGNHDNGTVRCEIPRSEDDWTYSWFKEGSNLPFSTDRELIVQDDASQNKITCRGERRRDGQMSEISDAVTVTSTNRPKVTVNPQSSVFTGDTVTLSCDVGQSAGPSIIWYKNFKRIEANKATLKHVNVSDGGEYRCAVAGNTIQSPGVKLTVRNRPKAVVRVQPDGRVLRGETVTLTCDIQHSDVSSWNYSWSKDDSLIHVSESQEYRISSVNESHTGRYSCTGRETRGSRYSHTSDQLTLTVSGSSGFRALVIAVASGLSAGLLLIFLILLHWCCKHHKGKGSQSSPTVHQQHNGSQNTELQSGKTGETPLTIYSKLKMVTV